MQHSARPPLLPPQVAAGRPLLVRSGTVELPSSVLRVAREAGADPVLTLRLQQATSLPAGAPVEVSLGEPGRGLLVLAARVVAGADGTVDVEVDPAGTRLDQRRRFARVPLRSPATLVLPGGVVACRGVDLSGGGLRVALPAPGMTMSAGDTAVAVLVLEGVARLPVRVRCVGADDTVVRLAFESVTQRAERRLCRHVFELEREQRARAARVD